MPQISRLPIPLLALLLSACVTAGTAEKNSPEAVLLANLSQSGLSAGLDNAARSRAAKAELEALETGLAGVPVKWVAGSSSGEVTPDPAYMIGDMRCRRYRHVIIASGQSRTVTGTACRDQSGIWNPLD